MKIKATAATLGIFKHNGTEFAFTEDRLIKLAETAKDVPITLNFDPDSKIGKIDSAKVVDGKLVVTGTIYSHPDCKESYLVPGYRVPDYKSIAYGITKEPCDMSVGFVNLS